MIEPEGIRFPESARHRVLESARIRAENIRQRNLDRLPSLCHPFVTDSGSVDDLLRRSASADERLGLPVRSRTLEPARLRLSEPGRSRGTVESAGSRGKTVTWSSDRRSIAKNISEDRKVVKSQVKNCSRIL